MARTSPLSRGRRIAIWSLITLASLLAIVGDPRHLGQPPDPRQRQLRDDEHATSSGSRHPERPVDVPGQRGLRQRRHPRRARRAAAAEPEAAGRAARGGCAPAGNECRQQALDPAARAEPLRQRDHGHAQAAGRSRRGQDGRGHVDRERQCHVGSRSARTADRAEPRPARRSARPGAAEHGRDHRHALRPARPGAERRQGGPDRQHVGRRAGPRAVRGRDLPRCRRQARDAAHGRVGIRLRRAPRTRRPSVRRQLHRGRPRGTGVPRSGAITPG